MFNMVTITNPDKRLITLNTQGKVDFFTVEIHFVQWLRDKHYSVRMHHNDTGYTLEAEVDPEKVGGYLTDLLERLEGMDQRIYTDEPTESVREWLKDAKEAVKVTLTEWLAKLNYCDLKVKYEGNYDVLACPLMREGKIDVPEYAFIALNDMAFGFLYAWSIEQANGACVRTVFGFTVYADEATLKKLMKEKGIKFYDGFL